MTCAITPQLATPGRCLGSMTALFYLQRHLGVLFTSDSAVAIVVINMQIRNRRKNSCSSRQRTMIMRRLLSSVRLKLNSVCTLNDSNSLWPEDECSSMICNIHGQLVEYSCDCDSWCIYYGFVLQVFLGQLFWQKRRVKISQNMFGLTRMVTRFVWSRSSTEGSLSSNYWMIEIWNVNWLQSDRDSRQLMSGFQCVFLLLTMVWTAAAWMYIADFINN